jgi:hypothetical protein
MRIKTYKPKKRLKLHEGDAIPVLIDVGKTFATLGGMLSFFTSSFMMSFRTFFKAKRKVRDFKAKHEKIFDLR